MVNYDTENIDQYREQQGYAKKKEFSSFLFCCYCCIFHAGCFISKKNYCFF